MIERGLGLNWPMDFEFRVIFWILAGPDLGGDLAHVARVQRRLFPRCSGHILDYGIVMAVIRPIAIVG
jgi:hypothetical protein